MNIGSGGATSSCPRAARALLGMALLICGCASAGGWQSVTSAHVTVYAQGAGYFRRSALEPYEYSYALLAATLFRGRRAPEHIDILVLDSRTFDRVLGPYRVELAVAPEAARELEIGRHGLLVESGTPGGWVTDLFAYPFVHESFPAAPPWVYEGLAGLATHASYHVTPAGDVVCLSGSGSQGERQSMMPLSRLFGAGWREYDSGDYNRWIRFTGRNLMAVLFFAEDGRFRSRAGALLEALGGGARSTDAFARVYPDLPPVTLQAMVEEEPPVQLSSRDARALGLTGCPLLEPVSGQVRPRVGPVVVERVPEDRVERTLIRLRALVDASGYGTWVPGPAHAGPGPREAATR